MSTAPAERLRVLLSARDAARWLAPLRGACPEADWTLQPGDPARIDALVVAPGGTVADFAPFTRARLVQSLWTGVERLLANPTLVQPLARMVDPGLTRGMAEYCTGWTLRAHLGMDGLAQDGVWRNAAVPPLAADRPVAVLGMGTLGTAVARMLSGIGFPVTGWSASGRGPEGVPTRPAADLDAVLAGADIVIALLPHTPATTGLLEAGRLARMRPGAWLINAGRGTLIPETDLLAALDAGRPGHAVLDVFAAEPVPPDHPFWRHPCVTVTPHIAAATRPETAAAVVAGNLRRLHDGRPLRHLVDRARGY